MYTTIKWQVIYVYCIWKLTLKYTTYMLGIQFQHPQNVNRRLHQPLDDCISYVSCALDYNSIYPTYYSVCIVAAGV